MEKREYDKEKERQTVTFFFIFVAPKHSFAESQDITKNNDPPIDAIIKSHEHLSPWEEFIE
jgi:hypothetical protein